MRWAFWRKRRAEPTPAPSEPAFGAWQPGGGVPQRPAARDGADEPPVGGAAFSGASPQPDSLASPAAVDGAPPPPGFLTAYGDSGPEHVELEPLRADLVALVRALQLGDRDDLDAARRRIRAYSEAAAGLAFVGALGLLGERFLAAAGIAPEQGQPGSPGAQAAIEAGDRVAARAQPVLQELAPDANPLLVPWLVRFSVGMPELAQEPDQSTDEDVEQLALVLAILLAQTCIDGQGSPEQLGTRFVALFAG